MLPWIIYYWFWPTVVILLFLSHHSLSLMRASFVSSSIWVYLRSFSHRIGFFQNLLWSRLRCVCSCWGSVTPRWSEPRESVKYYSCQNVVNDQTVYDFDFPLDAWVRSRSRAYIHQVMSYIHVSFLLLLGCYQFIRYRYRFTSWFIARTCILIQYPIIDICFVNAVINFWACFVSCLPCVRITACNHVFLVSFFFSFFPFYSSRA